jgi:hypothetical protein
MRVQLARNTPALFTVYPNRSFSPTLTPRERILPINEPTQCVNTAQALTQDTESMPNGWPKGEQLRDEALRICVRR